MGVVGNLDYKKTSILETSINYYSGGILDNGNLDFNLEKQSFN